MKCQILFSGKNKKNVNLSSTEYAQKVVTIKRLFILIARKSEPFVLLYRFYKILVCCLYLEKSESTFDMTGSDTVC